ncbi:Methylglutaconyl-CoA hydratase, mitochondrial [Zancudomyces culisetae]|uniref:Methylglutaconyl-CoA hydratase, mitochondrial n=1 Tax=Zancudomyces culisetae TaxID=1213189 RepID=A0A1R1PF46_ZANCU|nr:Methylglutaconyl-CoA hydratase, mitochondrial [Zancudomyces culisetae]|eukprot:OMH79549.1 Methylglutaconyl-CoA hydratase, mitochondrial [Zancudomyces culisetae]
MTQQEVWDFLYTLKQTFSELEELQIPTIAALDGAAFGGGLEMALSCDMRVAGKKGILGLTETSLAIIPGAGGTQRLTKLIGASKAKELIYTSARINPELSYQYGVISDYVGNNEKRQIADTKGVSNSGYELALEWARRIAMQGPVAVKMAKKAIDMGAHTDLKTGLGIEHQCYTTVLGTEDRNEGLLAFKEKRKPIYKGK